jgi:hypothetical protein
MGVGGDEVPPPPPDFNNTNKKSKLSKSSNLQICVIFNKICVIYPYPRGFSQFTAAAAAAAQNY